ncbi:MULTISPECIES: hypothetical protein [unclassified Halomonas]|uniref:hypothetical protein n=1 Tax=unclassified Halomonas TaxID=2609666 RepID=UPI0020767D1B|nr:MULTISPECIES: hypothetical protein [unclassified Halomonas]
MIPVKDGAVTRLIPESTRVVDLLREYGCMPVFKRSAARRGCDDKPATFSDRMNDKRRAAYSQRANGQRPAHLQLWTV